jgi:MFS family permease
MSERGGAVPKALIAALVMGQLGIHATMAGLRMAAALQTLREGAGAWAVGLLLALFSAAAVVSALKAGQLADRFGYHRPVRLAVLLSMAGAGLAVASTLVEGAGHFVLLCGAALVTGAAVNIGMLAIQRTAGLMAEDNTARVKVFSWLGVAPAFSNVIGPVLTGVVIDLFGFRAAYALLMLLPLVTAYTASRVPARLSTPAGQVQPANNSKAWDLLRLPALTRLLTVNWLLAMCWDVHLFAVPVLGHERGFNASTVGLILGTFTASVTLVRLGIPLLAHRLSDLVVLRAAMLGTALVFLLYPLAPNAWLMGLCAAALGVSLGSVQPMVMSLLHEMTPHERHGQALALRSMVMNASGTVMPLVFGASGAWMGAAALFWLVGAMVGSGSWLVGRLRTQA